MIPPAARPAAHEPGPARAVEDRRTTLMIKNIPNKYTQKMLLQTMDEQFRGGYDFFYLPIDFKNKCNVGYAFINLVRCESGRALACGHAPLGVPGVLAGARVLRFVWGALRGRSASWRWNTLESFWGALPAVSEPAFVLGPWLSGRLWRPDVCRGRTAPRSLFAPAVAAAACGRAIPAPLGAGAGAPEATARARARAGGPRLDPAARAALQRQEVGKVQQREGVPHQLRAHPGQAGAGHALPEQQPHARGQALPARALPHRRPARRRPGALPRRAQRAPAPAPRARDIF